MLTILYRDDYLVSVAKPPGLLVHRTGLDAGETRFALQLLRDQIGRQVWPVLPPCQRRVTWAAEPAIADIVAAVDARA